MSLQQQQQQQQQEGIITTRSKSRLESFDAAELLSEPNDGLLGDNHRMQQQQQHHNTRARTRSIPVPVPQPEQQQQPTTQSSAASASASYNNNYPPQTQSAASSQGSSGSAFLSSVLNPPNSSSSTTLLSHTPPTALGTSYENAHFGKRPRSGSVSGRLRSASEYLEEKGLLDRQTKGILKDLIIIGDEELQQALDHYEAGDPSSLEQMIQSGALQNRLPQDLDILGDLDLDFLTMDDEDMVGVVSAVGDQHIDALPNQYHVEKYMPRQPQGEEGDNDDDVYNATDAQVAGALHALAHQPHSAAAAASKTITPNDDDNTGMVGDLEFAGEFVSDHTAGGDEYSSSRLHQQQQQHYAYKDAAASSGESPPTDYNAPLSDYEKRLRSNSLFSALLDPATRHAAAQNAATGSAGPAGGAAGGSQYGQWMDRYPPITTTGSGNSSSNRPGGIQIGGGKARGRSKAGGGGSNNRNTSAASGLAASLEADRKKREKEEKKRERQERKEKKQQEKKRAAATAAAAMEEEAEDQHVPGSGRPRSLSDSQLRYSLDEQGLQQCERPEGWIGAYSPDSRKVRIGRFLEKRNHRVWTKTVKYDVRKNFADSRLRVKGRFVKKEDELMMRELMSLT